MPSFTFDPRYQSSFDPYMAAPQAGYMQECYGTLLNQYTILT
jgi:hypothetical protein